MCHDSDILYRVCFPLQTQATWTASIGELHLVQLWMVAFVLLWLISFTGIVFGWTPDVGLPALVLHTSCVVHLTGDRVLSFFIFFSFSLLFFPFSLLWP